MYEAVVKELASLNEAYYDMEEQNVEFSEALTSVEKSLLLYCFHWRKWKVLFWNQK